MTDSISSHISTRIPTTGLKNTRDLGGMRAADGRHIRKGRLLRSGHLYIASPEDLLILKELDIRKIYDFRSRQEREEKPDPLIGREENLHVPILRDLAAGLTRDRKSDEQAFDIVIRKAKEDPSYGLRYMCDTYRNLVSDPYAVSQYSWFLHDVAQQAEGAVLWHCTAGKDRAGFAAVLLLEILGVSREDILEDYLSTNLHLSDEVMQILAMLRKKLGLIGDEEAVLELFGAKEEFLDVIYRYVEEHFGGMEGFLKEGMHIDDSLREQFRENYLE